MGIADRHNRWLAVAAALVSALAAGRNAPAATERELLERAKTARIEAEKALAEARKQHLEQRKALAAQLQQAYEELSAATREAEDARRTADRLRDRVAGVERSAEQDQRRLAALIAQAAGAGGVALDANSDPAVMEQAVWRGLERRLAELEADMALTVQPGEVVARDGASENVTILHFGGYAAYACGPADRTRGLLRKLPDGRRVIVGPLLEGPLAEALTAAANRRIDRLPVDVTGALADREPLKTKDLRSWLALGGLFVYPILAAGALGLVLIADRVLCLLRARVSPAKVRQVVLHLRDRDAEAARQVMGRPDTPLGRVLWAAADAIGCDDEQREAAMESALLAEAPRMERSLSLLAALAGVAPLLGLLGTVSGMIATFEVISAAGTGNPKLLSGGISEALITTQLGLMVAIPLLLAHAWLSRWVQRREAMLEYHAVQAFAIHHQTSDEQKADR